ncbi:hypothetical protein [Natronorubrum tibetense]|uniref:Uncharacterized protein n=1 Tax=Natronorubrum tibetense GA33 TaxID=1114856 RepID=L9VKS9_9EURY|nr:hypothetical protein [Natronorubrum tibetense]ELY37754.1 hypothetical protein C496_19640 [Natronorubrum tibetense GA33]
MFRKLLSLYIGSRWRSFCGIDRDEFTELAIETLDELEYDYTHEVTETTSGEKYMLTAGDEKVEIAIKAPEQFTIQVVTAKANPGVGYALKFFSTKEMREEMTSNACVVDIQDVTKTTRPRIAQFMQRVIEQSDHPPWKVTHHVGFRLAFLLRWKIRILWKYWLGVDHDPATDAA